jgi:PLP dependent protein
VARDDTHRRIRENLKRVEERIEQACAQAGRHRDEVTLVAVTKTRSLEEVLAAYACGLCHLGENRVEELETRRPEVAQAVASDPPSWHMIGHIQSRKAARAAAVSDVVHSVDSFRLAQRLEHAAAALGRVLPILIEVNVSGEAAKYGFDAATPAAEGELMQTLGQMEELAHLSVQGLMTMAPIVPEPELARPVFARLRQLRERLRQELPYSSWAQLSMGMTDDFTVAIQEGATLVRIGRAIFAPPNEA